MSEKDNTTPQKYIICDYNGCVAVYNVYPDGLKILTTLTRVCTENLPPADRESLKEGIEANDRESLIRILEDFSS